MDTKMPSIADIFYGHHPPIFPMPKYTTLKYWMISMGGPSLKLVPQIFRHSHSPQGTGWPNTQASPLDDVHDIGGCCLGHCRATLATIKVAIAIEVKSVCYSSRSTN